MSDGFIAAIPAARIRELLFKYSTNSPAVAELVYESIRKVITTLPSWDTLFAVEKNGIEDAICCNALDEIAACLQDLLDSEPEQSVQKPIFVSGFNNPDVLPNFYVKDLPSASSKCYLCALRSEDARVHGVPVCSQCSLLIEA